MLLLLPVLAVVDVVLLGASARPRPRLSARLSSARWSMSHVAVEPPPTLLWASRWPASATKPGSVTSAPAPAAAAAGAGAEVTLPGFVADAGQREAHKSVGGGSTATCDMDHLAEESLALSLGLGLALAPNNTTSTTANTGSNNNTGAATCGGPFDDDVSHSFTIVFLFHAEDVLFSVFFSSTSSMGQQEMCSVYGFFLFQ